MKARRIPNLVTFFSDYMEIVAHKGAQFGTGTASTVKKNSILNRQRGKIHIEMRKHLRNQFEKCIACVAEWLSLVFRAHY